MSDQLLFVSDAARLLGKSSQTVRNYEQAGKLPSMRTAHGTRIFRESDVKRLAEQMQIEAPMTAA